MLRSIIALGANLPSTHGSPRETLSKSVALLTESGLQIDARSRDYATPAWPAGSGPEYVNGAVAVSGIGGDALLSILKEIEGALGRESKAGRWDARICDLDLLCTGQAVLPDRRVWQQVAAGPAEAPRPGLILPHPLLHSRAFVLIPMADVAGDWRHPILEKTVAQMIDALPREDVDSVRPLAG